MTNLIVIVNGYPGSGKDTATDFLVERLRLMGWRAKAYSIIDPVREFLELAGIGSTDKTPEYRKLMADIMDLIEAHDNVLSRYVLRVITHSFANYPLDIGPGRSVAFLHVRQIDVIRWIQANAPARSKVITLAVNRGGVNQSQSNTADAGVWDMVYDLIIGNHGTIDDLRGSCQMMASEIDRRGRAD